MSVPLSSAHRWARVAALPAVLGALPALALTASAGLSGAPGAAAPATTATAEQLATGFVRAERVGAPGAPATMLLPSASARYAGAIDTSNRAAVNNGYWSDFVSGIDTPIGWTGSVSGCQKGTSSSASRGATLRALNFVRRLAGLAPVTFTSTLNGHAQAAALIMAANNQLDHNPPSSWRCYSRTGASTAARSNLALSYPDITSGRIVQMYMDDAGTTNRAVGHRRWVLNPFATAMGTGSTGTANALQVIGPSSRTRPNPAYVGWPTAGWFPATMEPQGRWSLSAGNSRASFRYASVHVYRGTRQLTVHRFAVENGYAQPTVVWQMPSGFSRTGSYRVVVRGIRHPHTTKRFRTSYTVSFFKPSP